MGVTNQLSLLSAPNQDHINEAYAAMQSLGIAHLRDAGYGEISGGERQLTLIARALVQKAKVLIMDEPTANLDYGNQFRVMCRISDLAKEGYIIILSTHNPDHAFLYANRVLTIQRGKVIADGSPDDVLDAKLIKDVYNVDVHIEEFHSATRHHKLCIPIEGGVRCETELLQMKKIVGCEIKTRFFQTGFDFLYCMAQVPTHGSFSGTTRR